jgi:uncharacterized protein
MADRRRTMKRIGFVAAGFLAGAVLALQLPSIAQDSGNGTDAETRTITVSGTATVTAKPDEAVVSLGVHTEGESAEATMNENAARMRDVIAALKALGIGDDDIATASLNLYPTWSNDGRTVIGYQAENQLSVTVHDMDTVGKVIDRAVNAGANLAGGISFGLSDDNQGVNDALAQAIDTARAKAEAMAGAADASLGDVVTINETSAATPMPYYETRDYAAVDAGGSTPVNPPTIETQVSVTVTWALG